MERVLKFLKEAETYYLVTVEGDQPRVRPFGTAHIFEGSLPLRGDMKSTICDSCFSFRDGFEVNSGDVQKRLPTPGQRREYDYYRLKHCKYIQ